MKKLLRENYDEANPLIFHEFENGFHAHFNELYRHPEYFGGDEDGAVYVWPLRIVKGQLICQLTARGQFKKEYNGTFQAIPLEHCVFYSLWGEVPYDEIFAKPKPFLDGGERYVRFLMRKQGYIRRIKTVRGPVYIFASDQFMFDRTRVDHYEGYVLPMKRKFAEKTAKTMRKLGMPVEVVKVNSWNVTEWQPMLWSSEKHSGNKWQGQPLDLPDGVYHRKYADGIDGNMSFVTNEGEVFLIPFNRNKSTYWPHTFVKNGLAYELRNIDLSKWFE